VLNAANEVAVQAFIDRRISFPRITEVVSETCQAIDPAPVHSMDDVTEADRRARGFAMGRIEASSSNAPGTLIAWGSSRT
jgi:1-deoxy-D-xylulose-5-phosphate reductoisomerase